MNSLLLKVKKIVSSFLIVAMTQMIVSPIFLNQTYAGTPDVVLSYSKNPAWAGNVTITASYSETLDWSWVFISIDQSGTDDVLDVPMIDAWTGSIYTYSYTVNPDNWSDHIDGTVNVSLSWAVSLLDGQPANSPTGWSFVIDTTPPLITLIGSGSVVRS